MVARFKFTRDQTLETVVVTLQAPSDWSTARCHVAARWPASRTSPVVFESATPPADLYCVMGNPVAYSRSPAIHARFAELTGEYIALRTPPDPMDGLPRRAAFAAEGRARLQRHRALQVRSRRPWPPNAASACNWPVANVLGFQRRRQHLRRQH